MFAMLTRENSIRVLKHEAKPSPLIDIQVEMSHCIHLTDERFDRLATVFTWCGS